MRTPSLIATSVLALCAALAAPESAAQRSAAGAADKGWDISDLRAQTKAPG